MPLVQVRVECVLILLCCIYTYMRYMCPHTTTYVSAGALYYTCAYIPVIAGQAQERGLESAKRARYLCLDTVNMFRQVLFAVRIGALSC